MDDKEPVKNTDYQDRLAVLRANVGEIFESPHTVLYIGAKESRWDYVPELYDAGCQITVLEAFEENANGLYGHPYFYKVIHGDVRNIDTIDLGANEFDIVFWWHGPEHVHLRTAKYLLEELEIIASKYIVLGTPWGQVPQGVVGGNYYEVHLSYWETQDFKDIGYEVRSIAPRDTLGSCLVAWKEM